MSVPLPPSTLRKVRSATVMVSLPAPPWKASAPPPPVMDVVALAADEGLGGGRAGQRVGAAGPGEDHAAGEVAAEDDDRLAGIGLGAGGAVAASGPDDQVVEAVAIDVAGRGDRKARLVIRIGAEDAEARAGRDEVRRGDIDIGEAGRLAEHHDRLAGIGLCVGRRRRRIRAPTIRSSKPSPLMSPAEETE